MSSRAQFRRKELEGTPLGDGKHSANQKIIGRERLGWLRLYGNPNSKVEKKKLKLERESQGGSESKET